MTTDLGNPVIGPERQLPAHTPARRRRRALPGVLGLIIAVLVALLIFLVARRRSKHAAAAPGQAQAPVMVTTAVARQGDIDVRLQAIGTVTPVYTVSITSQVSGRVDSVEYTEGQHVQKGDPLVEIDSRLYRATLEQALGVLRRDQSLLAQAKMDLERYRAAWAKNAIAKQTLDDQEKIVMQNEGTVQNDLGAVEYDRVQVEFCHITSPVAGRIGLRLVDPGNVVQANGTTPLAVITQIEPITVVFTISEDNLDAVRARLAAGAELAVDALDRTAQKKIASGKLLTLDNQIDPTTGTVKARALFGNADDALFPNQFVNTSLVVDTHRGVTLLPSSAIQQNGTQSYVYVVQGGVARARNVKTSAVEGDTTQVDGVAPGEVVADGGFARLHDGAKVVVSTAPAPAATGAGAP